MVRLTGFLLIIHILTVRGQTIRTNMSVDEISQLVDSLDRNHEDKLVVEYAYKGIEKAGRSELSIQVCKFYNLLSKYSRINHNLNDAIKFANTSLSISRQLNDSTGIYKSLIYLGNANYSNENIISAKEMYEESLRYCRSKMQRSLALNNLANIHLLDSSFVQAIRVLEESRAYSKSNKDWYNYNENNICLANAYVGLDSFETADYFLELAEEKARNNKWYDQLSEIYNTRIEFISKEKGIPEIARFNDSISSMEHLLYKDDVRQLEEIYENEHLSNKLSLEQSLTRTRQYQILGLVASLIIMSLLFLYYTITRKLKSDIEKTRGNLKRQQALTNERTRIASEMHDDLGGGLTTIKFLSQKTLRKTKDEAQKKDIQKIVTNAQTLVGNMSEIIWAMNAGFDTVDNLVAYCRRYAREYLDDHELELKFESEGVEDDHSVSGEKRRNVFLVLKEALHNIVKHAQANRVELAFKVDQELNVSISDNGIGLPNDISQFGNGLDNMRQRIESLDGKLEYINDNGLTIKISMPLEKE